jgi:hypothetical protein
MEPGLVLAMPLLKALATVLVKAGKLFHDSL